MQQLQYKLSIRCKVESLFKDNMYAMSELTFSLIIAKVGAGLGLGLRFSKFS